MNKRDLTERDICTKFIFHALRRAGWDEMLQVREEVYFAKGRIIVRRKLVTRGKAKKADFVLYYKPNIPIAIIEAKDNKHSVDDQTMSLVRCFADQYGCSDGVALRFLLKIGKYLQGVDENDETYAARLDALPDPNVVLHWVLRAANDV